MKQDIFADVKGLSVPGIKGSASGRGRRSKVSVQKIRELVAELRPDDGLDPREEAKRRRHVQGDHPLGRAHGVHKQEQLLSEVSIAIQSALETAATPILNSLSVQGVGKQGGSLVVVLTPRNADEALDVVEATRALEKAASMLSREVAASITRKEAPHLRFVVLPAGSEKIDE